MEICQATLSSGKKIEEKATEGSKSKLSQKNKLKGHKVLGIKSAKVFKGPRSQERMCLGLEKLEDLSQNPDFLTVLATTRMEGMILGICLIPRSSWAKWYRNKIVVVPNEVIAQIRAASMKTLG